MLAVERARQLVDAGRQVLLVCFNRALAAHIAATTKADELEVSTFHALCTSWARRETVELRAYDGEIPQEFWDEDLPAALVEAIAAAGGGRYDDQRRAAKHPDARPEPFGEDDSVDQCLEIIRGFQRSSASSLLTGRKPLGGLRR